MSGTYLFGPIVGSCEGFCLNKLVVGLVLWREVEQKLFGLFLDAGDHCLIELASFLRQLDQRASLCGASRYVMQAPQSSEHYGQSAYLDVT